MGFGTDDPVVVDGVPRCRFPYLVSYAYLRNVQDDQIARILSDNRREVLLDSGAFTAFNAGKVIELSEYMAFLRKWGHRLFAYMLLDKLQDPVQTEANWRTMLADGLSPVPIHVFGEGADQMEEFFSRAPYVALGGLRRPHRGPAPIEYVKQKMTWAAGRPVHWLGYTNQQMIRTFRPFSVDCATAWSATQFGNCSIYIGGSKWWVGTFDEWRKLSTGEKRTLRGIVAGYDVNPDALDDKSSWNWYATGRVAEKANTDRLSRIYKGVAPEPKDHMTAILSVRSYVCYIYDVRRNLGTRMFLACTPENRYDRIVDGALELAHKRGWDRPLGTSGGVS